MLNSLNRTEKSSENSFLTVTKGINYASSQNDLVEIIFTALDDSGDDLQKLGNKLLIKIASHKEIIQGLFLLFDGVSKLNYLSCYAYNNENINDLSFNLGEGLPGQVALDRKLINLRNVPEGYIRVKTGLGEATPNSLMIFPVEFNETLIGVIELASFKLFSADDELFFHKLSKRIGEKIAKFSNMEIQKNG